MAKGTSRELSCVYGPSCEVGGGSLGPGGIGWVATRFARSHHVCEKNTPTYHAREKEEPYLSHQAEFLVFSIAVAASQFFLRKYPFIRTRSKINNALRWEGPYSSRHSSREMVFAIAAASSV